MDSKRIEEAISKAIRSGAVGAPYIPQMAPDDNLSRAETDVGVSDPKVLEDYVAELARDPAMVRFDSAYVLAGLGGSFPTSLASVARLLLACAIKSGDVVGTIDAFRSYVEKNSTSAMAVTAVSGVKVEREVELGP